MAIPTIGVSTVGLHDPDNHRFAVGRDGLTRVISPLWTHDWQQDPEASEEDNLARRRAMVDRSRARFMEQMQGYQITFSFVVSNVVRDHPERAVNIPGSGVWVVVMPPPERPKRQRSAHGDDSDDEFRCDFVEEDYHVAVLDGRGGVEMIQDGPLLLRQAHRQTGRPHSLHSIRIQGMQQRRDPWNGEVLADDEAVPNHLPEAVAVIGETYLIQQRPSNGDVSAGLERAITAVRALGGESAELLERIITHRKS